MKKICAVVLAAGKGTRMGGDLPKVLYRLAGKPMIYWPLHLIKECRLEPGVVVTGYKASDVEKKLKEYNFNVKFARQTKQLGTAHSLVTGLKLVHKSCKTIVVLYADDSVLYTKKTIKDFVNYHLENKNKATLLTLERKIPTDIGALRVDKNGKIVDVMTLSMIIGEKLPEHQILCGAFCFDKDWIERMLPLIPPSSLSGEYPLPGIIKVAVQKGDNIDSYKITDNKEWCSINTLEELKEAERLKKKQLK